MNNFNNSLLNLGLALAGLLNVSAHAGDIGSYEVTQRLPLGAATKWDFISADVQQQRLFVTRGDRVDVVAIPSGRIVGSISNTSGVHGVAIAQDMQLGFTSNGKTHSVTVFDLVTLAPKAEITLTGKNPDVILYEPLVHKVYVFNGGSADFEVIDATSLKVVDRVKVNGRPEFAVSDEHGKIYFNVEDKSEMGVIDVASNKLLTQWPLADCTDPTGLAIDVKNARLFSACANGVAVVTDAHSGKQVAKFAIGGSKPKPAEISDGCQNRMNLSDACGHA
jgi:YVTN family beta-propeller protein